MRATSRITPLIPLYRLSDRAKLEQIPSSLAVILMRAAILLALLSLPGCKSPFGSGDYRELLAGVYSVTAPDTVGAGSSFDVVMISQGGDGCWKPGRCITGQSGPLQATIIPFDEEYVGHDLACTDNLPALRHSVRLPTTKRGIFEVTVKTYRRASTGKDSVGVILRTVVVR